MTGKEKPSDRAKRTREERLAAQLRENLRRRKEQARVRAKRPEPEDAGEPESGEET